MSAPLTEQRLAEIAARETAATPGPWGVYDDGTARLDVVARLVEIGTGYTGRREIAQTVESPMDNDPAHVAWDDEEDAEQCRADGAFIAAARTDVPALLAEVARLRAIEVAVTEFLADRAEYITAIRNCHPDNGHDYHRWQGHAESRRQLAEKLGLPVAWPEGGAS